VNASPTTQARLRVRAADGSGAFALSDVFTVLESGALRSAPLFNFQYFGCDGGTGVTTPGFGQVDYSQTGSGIDATVRVLNGPRNATLPVLYFATGGGPCQAFSIGSVTTDSSGAGTGTVNFDIAGHTIFFVVIDGGTTQWGTTPLPAIGR
jgi:hypothetical protein